VRPLPLRLALEPLLPARTPTTIDCFEYGFRLRLPGGPMLTSDDPLLTAFGASVECLQVGEDHEEALQADAFDPGNVLRLMAEPYDPDDPDAVGVWDDDSLRQAGTLLASSSAVVSAGAQAGLEHRARVLCELRAASDDRREALCLLVFAPALVRVNTPRSQQVRRPVRPSRPRLVLVADASGDVRWWDPSASSGPLEACDLPFSQELRHELDCLRDAFAVLAADGDEQRGFDRVQAGWERDALQAKAQELWCRARSELGRRYAVGFLGSGMSRPMWTPAQPVDDDDDYSYGEL
jgi:hypothetical protein